MQQFNVAPLKHVSKIFSFCKKLLFPLRKRFRKLIKRNFPFLFFLEKKWFCSLIVFTILTCSKDDPLTSLAINKLFEVVCYYFPSFSFILCLGKMEGCGDLQLDKGSLCNKRFKEKKIRLFMVCIVVHKYALVNSAIRMTEKHSEITVLHFLLELFPTCGEQRDLFILEIFFSNRNSLNINSRDNLERDQKFRVPRYNPNKKMILNKGRSYRTNEKQ
jgi:hypothetical protein